ncbi:MAG: glycosyltransferase [Eggerthellaceae bacterium]
MNPAVIIPTFYTTPMRKRGEASSLYDHPTPLNSKGTLERCLASLQKVKGLGQVIILVAVEGGVEAEAAAKVKDITDRFPQMHTLIIAQEEASIISRRLEQLSFGPQTDTIGLTGYAAVRNLGLVVAQVLGFDSVVFIDDDEVVEDEEFLEKAMYGLGKLTKKGIPILAKSGFYFNDEGTYYSKSQNRWYNHFWQQGRAFNNWITKAMAGPRLSRSNHVCGGCLALHRETYRRLSFDPWIMRGEDMDYLLSLRMYGSDIWFDNQWSLTHLPPSDRNEGHRFYRDIFRWIYEYYKIEFSRAQIDLLQIKPSSLMPYPGPFLEPGITKRIKRTAFLRSLVRPDKKAYREGAKAAAGEATDYAKINCTKYFEFQYTWSDIMVRMESDAGLRQALIRAAMARQAGEEIVVETAAPSESPAAGMPDAFDEMPKANLDPGLTGEIHLNLSDEE